MQGRFNLNSLVTVQDGKQVKDEIADARFVRLLDLLELEEKWAGIIVDWIDSDIDAGLSRRRRRLCLHQPDAGVSRREHADHARERVAGVARLRHRTLSTTRAFRDCIADRHAASIYALPRPKCSIRSSKASVEYTLARENMTRDCASSAAFRICRNSIRRCDRSDARRTGGCQEKRSARRAPTSARRSGSLLALPSSPCTVCCIAPTPTNWCVPY